MREENSDPARERVWGGEERREKTSVLITFVSSLDQAASS